MGHVNKAVLRALLVVLVFALLVSVAGCKKTDLGVIKQRGKMIVGTSADYPPMEYVVDGKFEGFDMDLIREIGKRMGVQVEIQDMAFDTLIAALKQGKVDVVIAAMSASEERRAQADFSDVYHESIHGFIIKAGSAVELSTGEDTGAYKTGVQTGTTHEAYVMDLVAAGKMEEKNIYRYEKADIAVLDVAAGRIDVYIADLPVAKSFIKTIEGLEIGLEFNVTPEEGGERIAVRKDSKELLDEVNKHLRAMIQEGFIETLEEKHLSEV